jgi:DNA-binding LacI/PurR family transcriptional regulator
VTLTGVMPIPINIPDAITRRRIAAEAPVTERRVLLAYRNPSSVQPCTLERVRRAAVALGVAPPGVPATPLMEKAA